MKVFVSSVYQDGRTPSEERHLAIRHALWDEGRARGHDMWIAEYSRRDLTDKTPWRQIVDTCTAGVTKSQLVLAFFFRRWGSPIDVDNLGPSATTFFEIELFHASLRRVPVYFLRAEDFQPEPELNRLIKILETVTESSQWITAPESELKGIALRLIDQADQKGAGLVGLTDGLSNQRSFRRVKAEIDSTRLSFLGGFSAAPSGGSFSANRVQALLSDAKSIGDSSSLNYVDRLSRLWMALRELSLLATPELGPDELQAWTDLADLWAGPAAWLRLHGPLRLGVLAALQTRTDLNERSDLKLSPAYGAFASEAYSIGKISATWPGVAPQPAIRGPSNSWSGGSNWTPRTAAEIERDRQIGLHGEALVYHSELKRVRALGYENPEAHVTWVSKDDPGADHDIRSIGADGGPIWIEVKSTTGTDGRFEWSIAEFEKALREGPRYQLWRVYGAGGLSPLAKRFENPANLLRGPTLRLELGTLRAFVESR